MPRLSNRVVFYQDKAGEWRWTLYGGNNRIMDASSEGFHSYSNAKRNFLRVRDVMWHAKFIKR